MPIYTWMYPKHISSDDDTIKHILIKSSYDWLIFNYIPFLYLQ